MPVMPVMRAITMAMLGALASSACATVEHVGRPPSAAEIARMNEAVEEGRALAILGADLPEIPRPPPCAAGGCAQPQVQPLASCAGGSCGPPPSRPVRDVPRTIAGTDGWNMTFDTKLGGALTMPLSSIAGVKISGADRARGAALGVTIGAGVDGVVGAFIWMLSRTGDTSPAPNSSPGCRTACEEVIVIAMVPALVAGAIVGAAIGVPRYFLFDAPPTGP
jgi:hypothetical protein